MPNSVRTRLLLALLAVALASGVARAAYTPFSLTITFAPSGTPAMGISGDVPYVDRAEGRVPTVAMNKDGGIVLDTRKSTRTVCFGFDAGPAAALAPAAGCYPVLLRTLVRAGDNRRVADLADGETLDFGMDVYWTGPGADGRTYDYVVEYKRVDGHGVNVTHTAPGTWTVENAGGGVSGLARVSVYRKGKGAGWSVVGLYEMPISFVAVKN